MTDQTGPGEGPGSPDTEGSGLSPDEEPVTTGTLFVMLLFLMALGGMWALMYMVLLER
ncbi:MAG: hypothetical protein PVI57_14960 [Gemmatimonadota bacterium]|jgi:hypothetical protein